MPVSDDRIGLKKKMGPAIYLHEFLVGRQTSADGVVNYGRPIHYAWIRAHWPGNWLERPSDRTLRRWMGKLRRLGLVEARLEQFNDGMRVRLVGSVKFAPDARRAPEQLDLIGGPLRMPAGGEKAVENPVENPVETVAARAAKNGRSVRPELAGEKQLRKEQEETIRAHDPRASSRPAGGDSNQAAAQASAWRRQQKARRILGELETLRSIYVGAQDPEALKRRNARQQELLAQLSDCSWQEERAG